MQTSLAGTVVPQPREESLVGLKRQFKEWLTLGLVEEFAEILGVNPWTMLERLLVA